MATTACRTCGNEVRVPLKDIYSEPQCGSCYQDALDNKADHLSTLSARVVDALLAAKEGR